MLETDASRLGRGALLSQKQEDGTIRPLAFASRTLQTHERNYGVTELEALAVDLGSETFQALPLWTPL